MASVDALYRDAENLSSGLRLQVADAPRPGRACDEPSSGTVWAVGGGAKRVAWSGRGAPLGSIRLQRARCVRSSAPPPQQKNSKILALILAAPCSRSRSRLSSLWLLLLARLCYIYRRWRASPHALTILSEHTTSGYFLSPWSTWALGARDKQRPPRLISYMGYPDPRHIISHHVPESM